MSRLDYILRKADLTVQDLISDGGYLNPEQADRFIELITDRPTILNNTRRVVMSAPKRKVEKIGFDSRILRAAPDSGETLPASSRSKPTTETVELETKEVIAEVHVPYDVLEDNIERGTLEDTIINLMSERIALDLEELLIKGDTSSSDDYLALTDGILNLITTNVVDLTGETEMNKGVLKKLLDEIDPKYIRNRNAFRFYMSFANDNEYRDTLADRSDITGAQLTEGYRPVGAYGVMVEPASLMPESNVVLTVPQNILWGVQRDIMIERDRDIRARTLVIVATLRVAIEMEEEKAAVLGENFGS